jgi:hypothetical protein
VNVNVNENENENILDDKSERHSYSH